MLSLLELLLFGGLCYGAFVYLVICHVQGRDIGGMGLVLLFFGFIGASTLSYGAETITVMDGHTTTVMNLTSGTNITATYHEPTQITGVQPTAWAMTHIAIALMFTVQIIFGAFVMVGRAWR